MIPVIIPFYKNKDQLNQCLRHLENQSLSVEVFIRDNTLDNVLFTAAVNQGIRHFWSRPATYLVVLNQDMYLHRDAIANMVAFMDRTPQCGIGAPLQLYKNNPAYVIWAGSYEAFPVGRHQHGPIDYFAKDSPTYWANGACMILRMEMIKEIGLLDENMAFIGSDCDYSLTARSRGWEIWRIASAQGIHEHGESGLSHEFELEARKARDMLHFSQKWLTGDLYRRLAFEGRDLSPETIREHVALLSTAEKLNSAAAKAKTTPDSIRNTATRPVF